MKLFIYSLFDQAAKAYTRPFFLQNDGIAIRAFQDQVNAKEPNNVSEHPEQFTLFCIGEFDDSNGDITPEISRSLGNGKQFVDEPSFTAQDLKEAIREVFREEQNSAKAGSKIMDPSTEEQIDFVPMEAS
jgi:hypothetical protein